MWTTGFNYIEINKIVKKLIEFGMSNTKCSRNRLKQLFIDHNELPEEPIQSGPDKQLWDLRYAYLLQTIKRKLLERGWKFYNHEKKKSAGALYSVFRKDIAILGEIRDIPEESKMRSDRKFQLMLDSYGVLEEFQILNNPKKVIALRNAIFQAHQRHSEYIKDLVRLAST